MADDFSQCRPPMRHIAGVNLGVLERAARVNAAIAEIPQIKRGQVWCTVCGHTQRVDGAGALQHGWPKHCGYTMTIDSPEERKALTERRNAQGA